MSDTGEQLGDRHRVVFSWQPPWWVGTFYGSRLPAEGASVKRRTFREWPPLAATPRRMELPDIIEAALQRSGLPYIERSSDPETIAAWDREFQRAPAVVRDRRAREISDIDNRVPQLPMHRPEIDPMHRVTRSRLRLGIRSWPNSGRCVCA